MTLLVAINLISMPDIEAPMSNGVFPTRPQIHVEPGTVFSLTAGGDREEQRLIRLGAARLATPVEISAHEASR